MLISKRAQERDGKEAQEIVTLEAEAGDICIALRVCCTGLIIFQSDMLLGPSADNATHSIRRPGEGILCYRLLCFGQMGHLTSSTNCYNCGRKGMRGSR